MCAAGPGSGGQIPDESQIKFMSMKVGLEHIYLLLLSSTRPFSNQLPDKSGGRNRYSAMHT